MQAPIDMFSAVFVIVAVLAGLAALFTVGAFISDVLLGENDDDEKN